MWWIPVGETPDRVLNHPDLKAWISPTPVSDRRVAPMTVTSTLLIYTGRGSDGTPYVYAVDKATGEQLGKVEAPAASSYGMMSYVHDDRQYIMLQTGSTLTAMALADY